MPPLFSNDLKEDETPVSVLSPRSSSISSSSSSSCDGQQLIIVLLALTVLLQTLAFVEDVFHDKETNVWHVGGHAFAVSFERSCGKNQTTTNADVVVESDNDLNESSMMTELNQTSLATHDETVAFPHESMNETGPGRSKPFLQDMPQFLRDMPQENNNSGNNALKVGLCAIIKGAEKYLDEWVDYNLYAIGFHEIYIYDNSDNHTLREWALKRSPRVHVVSFTQRSPPYSENKGFVQLTAMNACMKQFGGPRADVVAFFDDDEFLVLKKHRTVAEYAAEYLKRNTSLAINWRVFGTSNHTQYSPIPVTKRFQYRLNETDYGVKAMVWSEDHLRMANPHAVLMKHVGAESRRDANGQPGRFSPNGAHSFTRPDDVAVLHHYKYKSEAEYHEKSCIRKDVMDVARNINCGTKTMVGEVFDDSAWQILKTRLPEKYAHFDDWVDYF